HILIDDVPGVGKTTLVRMLASLLGLQFQRVQFTPDLMPSDITGTSVLNMKTQEFEFRPGPIFTQILLADEINRATPKTQAALLEAMQERQVTVDGVTYPLPDPFFVLATQNPVELEGTFPLPEAQLDRFLLKVRIGYPEEADEERILTMSRERRDTLAEALPEAPDVTELRRLAGAVRLAPPVRHEFEAGGQGRTPRIAGRSHCSWPSSWAWRRWRWGGSPSCSGPWPWPRWRGPRCGGPEPRGAA